MQAENKAIGQVGNSSDTVIPDGSSVFFNAQYRILACFVTPGDFVGDLCLPMIS
jgi:hypothetical protein